MSIRRKKNSGFPPALVCPRWSYLILMPHMCDAMDIYITLLHGHLYNTSQSYPCSCAVFSGPSKQRDHIQFQNPTFLVIRPLSTAQSDAKSLHTGCSCIRILWDLSRQSALSLGTPVRLTHLLDTGSYRHQRQSHVKGPICKEYSSIWIRKRQEFPNAPICSARRII